MRGVTGLLVTAGFAVVGVLALFWLFQRTLIYFPSGGVPAPGDMGLGQVEEVSFDTEDGLALWGWFFPVDRPRATVIVFNGNAGHRAYRGALATGLRTRGFQVLLFDYRGYGGNDGRPTEDGLRADARAALTYVRGRADVDSERIVYFGESLGTAMAIGLAAEEEAAGLVLRSPFASLVEVGRIHYPILPVEWLLADRFETLEDAARVGSPVLVIAGDADRIVPLEQSRKLFGALRAHKEMLVIEGAGHNDLELISGPELLDAVSRFVTQVG